ncbi:MAG: cysteine--tRNA ligase, partial [Candidatus Dormibacteria bacterium]
LSILSPVPVQLFDTMSRRLRTVEPLEPGHVRLYTCGPTVYARAHIGNFRTFVFEDILRRWLERRFDRVTHVMNLTDVEDKIIRQAMAAGRTLDEETAPHVAGFFEDVDALGICRAHHYPRATDYIDAMVEVIQRLGDRGVTYSSEGNMYFRIAAFPAYGRLSGVRAGSLVAGAGGRVDADEYEKEDARDFALWKRVEAGEPGWETPLGRGRPGWHIECSAMSMALLGESFDIHCGGVDNIFPHHENEIAQSEAATGKPFVSIWCHSAHLRIGGEKMAKSAGNFSTLRELLDRSASPDPVAGSHAGGGHDGRPDRSAAPGDGVAGTDAGEGGDGGALTSQISARPSAIRYLLAAAAHYRKPLTFGDDVLHMSTEAVGRLAAFRDRVRKLSPEASAGGGEEMAAIIDAGTAAFATAMDADLNLPEAMGAVFTVVRDANRLLDRGSPGAQAKQRLETFIADVDEILGVLDLVDREQSGGAGMEDQGYLDARARARSARDWAESDRLRELLRRRGIAVEDTPQGQRWHRET